MTSQVPDAEYLTRKFITLLNEHKFLDALELASPTATFWISGLKEQNPGAGLTTFEEHIHRILTVPIAKRLEVDIVDLFTNDAKEKAVVEIVSKMKGDDGTYQYRNDIVVVVHAKDGKIQSVREYMDYYPVQKFLKGTEGGNA